MAHYNQTVPIIHVSADEQAEQTPQQAKSGGCDCRAFIVPTM